MKTTLAILLSFLCISVFSQDPGYSIELEYYFKAGVEAFDRQDYIAADSLFQKAYNNIPEEKALYNLAVTKFMLDSLCKGCALLNFGKINYDEQYFTALVDQLCVEKIDTSYYDRKFSSIPGTDKYMYLLEEIQYVCDTFRVGHIHKKRHERMILSGSDLSNIKTVDIYATYILIDSVKYFTGIDGSTFYERNRFTIDQFLTNFEEYLNSKYDFSSLPYKQAYCTVNLFIDSNGNIENVLMDTFPYHYLDGESAEIIVEEIESTSKNIKGLKAERFMRSPVSKIFTLLIDLRQEK